MTNTERQRSLDKKKWVESEKSGIDKSGIMIYCSYCEYCSSGFKCKATQQEREARSLCAKAYNRLKRNSQNT